MLVSHIERRKDISHSAKGVERRNRRVGQGKERGWAARDRKFAVTGGTEKGTDEGGRRLVPQGRENGSD